jgi:hypothetical protein
LASSAVKTKDWEAPLPNSNRFFFNRFNQEKTAWESGNNPY